MSPKASSDFGLYREKQKTKFLTPGRITGVVVITVIFLGTITFALVQMIEPIENSPARAEKLSRQMHPKPFGLTYRGQQPSEFTTTTERVTTLQYPQVGVSTRYISNNIQEVDPRYFPQNFRGIGTRYFPNNIQEVIGYADYELKKKYKQSSSQFVPLNKHAKNFSLSDNDPFYFFKPQDPGEVNLLSTGSFRFAPPSWSNLKRKIPQIYNTKRNEVYGKPVSVTLNVYPNKERERRGSLRQFLSQRIENIQSRVGYPGTKPKKMVIQFNLYPQDLENQPREEQAAPIT